MALPGDVRFDHHFLRIKGLSVLLGRKTISELNVSHPFSEHITGHISKMSFIALLIGITAILTAGYADWLMQNQLHFTYEADGSEFLFLAGILFVIAVIFKRGIELQTENELTI